MTYPELLRRPLSELLVHRPPMILLDRLVSLEEERCESEVVIRPESRFCESGRVGGWVGIEYMAQTVAAVAGANGIVRGHGLRVGLLVGTRQYVALRPAFEVGTTLRVEAQTVFFDPQGLNVLDCLIRDHASGETVATARLNAFLVEDLKTYLHAQP